MLLIPLTAKDKAKLTKTINQSYPVATTSKLEVHNKYGDIILNNWDRDSIAIEITISAFGKNEDAAERLMERTDIQFDQGSFGVEVYTILNKSDGWLKDLWNEMSGYSQTIISKDQLSIDYQIYLPSDLDVEISNKYGDVFIPERSGATRLDISNGSLKAEDISGELYLDLRFGIADINKIRKAELSIKSAELNLYQGEVLRIQSSSSTIHLDEIQRLRLDSRTDKIYINQLTDINGQSSFSKIRLRNIDGKLDLESNYGALILENVYDNFSEVQFRGKSTDIDVTFEHMAYFNTRIIAKEGKFELPRDHGLKQVYTDGTEKFIKSTGRMGNMNSTPGEVNIDAQGGKVKLEFAPFDARSRKPKQ